MYFTIAAVLHSRRMALGEVDSLVQQEHLRRVLSPRCFDRFNDGVIQASLLRAAMLPELDYSTDETISKEMWQVLDFIFRARGVDAGEAYREFLVALALERLRLRTADVEQLARDHGEKAQDPIDDLLWKRIVAIASKRKHREQRSPSTALVEVPAIPREAPNTPTMAAPNEEPLP